MTATLLPEKIVRAIDVRPGTIVRFTVPATGRVYVGVVRSTGIPYEDYSTIDFFIDEGWLNATPADAPVEVLGEVDTMVAGWNVLHTPVWESMLRDFIRDGELIGAT